MPVTRSSFRPSLRRSGAVAAVAVTSTLLGAGAVALGPAAAALQIRPVGHHQVFVGETKGPMGVDTILLICAGPGGLGHPAAGQTVEVIPAPTTAKSGFTGSKADGIVVSFPSASARPSIELKAYDVPAAIPTSISLPCGTTGTVAFVPVPTSKTARPDLVQVAFDPGPGAGSGGLLPAGPDRDRR